MSDYPDARLERALMEEYLSEQGHTFEEVTALEERDREPLLVEAAAYAALRLCERVYL